MRRAIIGTAGHIDHGKTRLVEALTGIDCDRWAEEKRRGITIDLGFAHAESDELELGFIDVPGHEKFVHNALAGLGGIRLLLLVVAADEGVKPQTREHLAIAQLLPIPTAVVALTKIDLAAPELQEIARLEVKDLLASTRFADAPILPVSSTTGEGVEALRQTLFELAAENAQPEATDLPVRLPIDRAFHITGRGVIVTGTLASGELAEGMTLVHLPSDKKVRIRSIEVHGQARDRALAGHRVAAQIAGIELEDVHRGDYLLSEGAFEPSHGFLLELELLTELERPLATTTEVKLHLYSSEVVARIRPLAGPIEPGGKGLVEARLRQPRPAIRDDHVIIRRLSPVLTMGGGRILDPLWRKPRPNELAAALSALSSGLDEAVAWWAREAHERGLDSAELSARLGGGEDRASALLEEGARRGALTIAKPGRRPPRYISTDVLHRFERRAITALENFFARNRMATGMPRAELVSSLLPARAQLLADFYLSWLEKRHLVTLNADRVALPGRDSVLSGSESRLAREITQRYESSGLTPPSPTAVASELGAKTQIVEGIIRFLVDRDTLVRLPGGLILATSALRELRRDLAASGWKTFSVGQFKQRYGLSRKWAIPLLEHLDSAGFTRRLGDERMLTGREG